MHARTRCCAALGLACASFGLSARGAGAEACEAPKVHITLPPDPKWQDATSELSAKLRALPDLDKCARVLVRPSSDGVVLEITTSDGRSTARQIDSVAELLRTAEALLVLPPEPGPGVPRPSPQELPPPESRAARQAPPAATHVELGAGGSARLGGGPLYGGGGIASFAQFALDRWLLSVSARWDLADAIVTEPAPPDFQMESSAVGVSVGRRVELGEARVDALVGPDVVLEAQDTDDPDGEIHGAAADFRLNFTLRVSGPHSSTLRAFAAGDLEGSPARFRSAKYINRSLPELPSWSSGLTLGVLWSAR